MFLQLVGEEANFFLFYELDTQFFMIGSSGFLSITVVLSRLYYIYFKLASSRLPRELCDIVIDRHAGNYRMFFLLKLGLSRMDVSLPILSFQASWNLRNNTAASLLNLHNSLELNLSVSLWVQKNFQPMPQKINNQYSQTAFSYATTFFFCYQLVVGILLDSEEVDSAAYPVAG